jgi:hypothetical protein
VVTHSGVISLVLKEMGKSINPVPRPQLIDYCSTHRVVFETTSRLADAEPAKSIEQRREKCGRVPNESAR